MKTQIANNALDCSRPATALFWGLFGAALALTAFVLQGAPTWSSALRVGSRNPLLHQIERELGPLTVSSPTGHDGQLYYMVARDPFARGATVDALIKFDTPRYRYRRILVPLLAGGFGQFSPRTTLFGMIACAILGMALTIIGIADLAYKHGVRGASVFVAAFNLGAFVSVMLLTVDAMALGLSLVGVALLVRGHVRSSVIALALAALTKETYLVVALGLAIWQWREGHTGRAVALVAGPALPFLCWSAWLWFVIPGIPEPGLLSAPVVGMVAGVWSWLWPGRLDGVQTLFAIQTLISFSLAALFVVVGRSPVLRWVIVAWLLLACITGAGPWGIPTNIGRAFSMLWPLAILLLFEARCRPVHSLVSGR